MRAKFSTQNYIKITGDYSNFSKLQYVKTFCFSHPLNVYVISQNSDTNWYFFSFAIWNTTVGTSLLSMAWGIEKTGLFPAIFINIAIAAICLYTTYTLLKVNEKHGVIGQNGEVCDLCRALIGRWAEILAKIFSLVVLIGANIVYWILMSNFFYNSVQFFYGKVRTNKKNLSNNYVI